MIGNFFETMIIASNDKSGYNDLSKSNCYMGTVLCHLKRANDFLFNKVQLYEASLLDVVQYDNTS